jgi:Cys-tRNA(Pro) deacylase
MKDRYPVTPAIHFLRELGIEFTPHVFRYQEKGGTAHSSRELGVSEHIVIKTLVMETDAKQPLIVLMHGDKKVSTKELARAIGAKSVSPCAPERADRFSGYQVGGTSPFGTKTKMPVYLQKSILDFDKVFINGGGKGFLVSLRPADIIKALDPKLVDVAIDG